MILLVTPSRPKAAGRVAVIKRALNPYTKKGHDQRSCPFFCSRFPLLFGSGIRRFLLFLGKPKTNYQFTGPKVYNNTLMPFRTIEEVLGLFVAAKAVTIDSRKVPPGSVFFAIKGERFDGNAFAIRALEQGAAAAIVDDPEVASRHAQCWLVRDAQQTLQDLGHAYRNRFAIPVLGITGSNGKTTTKELVAAVLSRRYKTHFTQGNLNNHLGVPLTLLAMPGRTEMAVIEMGANHQGEIAHLSAIADPDYGLITNIGKAHLEGFGGIEGVKKGKSELYRHLEQRGGTAFVNLGEPFLKELVQGVPELVTYQAVRAGEVSSADIVCTVHEIAPFITYSFRHKGQDYRGKAQLFGAYNVQNIVTALAIGLHFEVPADRIVEAIADYQPGNNRSQLLERGSTTFLLDAYNANPTSLEHALRYLSSVKTNEKKMAIIGDMLELGETSQPEHERMVKLASNLSLDKVVFVGPHFADPAQRAGALHFKDIETLKAWFDSYSWDGYRILLKASRRLALERLLAKPSTESA